MNTFYSVDAALIIVSLGALFAGFTTGLAGFGTGLIASGFWFHALPAGQVPPLIAMASVTAQGVGLITLRKAFDWEPLRPFLCGGVIGVPVGVFALTLATPMLVKLSVGIFLALYASMQLSGILKPLRVRRSGRPCDAAIGVGGGFLGGFAGLSGPLPLIWLQLQGISSEKQRAIYRPFNLVVLTLAVGTMMVSGLINIDVMITAAYCLPMTLAGAWLGSKTYTLISAAMFRMIVLMLLLCSGAILIGQSFLSL